MNNMNKSHTKLDVDKWIANNQFTQSDFQTMLVHLSQSQVWLEMLAGFKPKGKLKERVNKAKQALFMLNQILPIEDHLFDLAIDLSDSLLTITNMSKENQEILINTIKSEIDKLTTNEQ